ncbi:hypothetical protein ES708_04887 [subsurface metagenome]
MRGIKDAFTWGKDDIGWLQAAPRYYFLCDEDVMPPQEHMNTGQKMWWFMVIVFGVVFAITGLIIWFAKTTAPPALLQWMVFIHAVAFIVTGLMLFVHIYLSVIHPLMRPLRTGAWSSMARGRGATIKSTAATRCKTRLQLSSAKNAKGGRNSIRPVRNRTTKAGGREKEGRKSTSTFRVLSEVASY